MRNHNSQSGQDLIRVFAPLSKPDLASWSSISVAISRSLQNLSPIVRFDSAAIVVVVKEKYEIIATSNLSKESAEDLIEGLKKQPEYQKSNGQPGKSGDVAIWINKLKNKKDFVMLETLDQPDEVVGVFIFSRPPDKELDLLEAFIVHAKK
ncbi:MAG: hypothetical protein ACUVQ7_08860, partial [bacterium]